MEQGYWYLNGVLFSGTEPVMYSPTPSLSTPTPQISPTPVATPSSVPTYQATPTPSGFETPVIGMEKQFPTEILRADRYFGVFTATAYPVRCHKFDPFRAFRK